MWKLDNHSIHSLEEPNQSIILNGVSLSVYRQIQKPTHLISELVLRLQWKVPHHWCRRWEQLSRLGIAYSFCFRVGASTFNSNRIRTLVSPLLLIPDIPPRKDTVWTTTHSRQSGLHALPSLSGLIEVLRLLVRVSERNRIRTKGQFWNQEQEVDTVCRSFDSRRSHARAGKRKRQARVPKPFIRSRRIE